MQTTARDGMIPGFVLGLVGAFGFALVIRFVPAGWLEQTGPRALLYAAQIPAGFLFLPVWAAVARRIGSSPRQVLLWVCCGALVFDGTALGFWPQLYGQEGVAQTKVATLLLFAFAWILIAGLLAADDRPA